MTACIFYDKGTPRDLSLFFFSTRTGIVKNVPKIGYGLITIHLEKETSGTLMEKTSIGARLGAPKLYVGREAVRVGWGKASDNGPPVESENRLARAAIC